MATFVRTPNGKVLFTDDSGNVYGLSESSNVIPAAVNEKDIYISNVVTAARNKEALRVDWETVTLPIVTDRNDLITKLSTDFFYKAPLQHVGLDLVSPFISTDLDIANQWYDVEGTYELTATPVGFEVINDVLTYKGVNDTSHHFAGSSDVKVSKNAILTYGLFVNDEVEPRGISVHTYSNPNAFELMAITKYIELNFNDEIRIKAKSDTVNTVMTPGSLNTTLTGVI